MSSVLAEALDEAAAKGARTGAGRSAVEANKRKAKRRQGLSTVYAFIVEEAGEAGKRAILLSVAAGLFLALSYGAIAQTLTTLQDPYSPLPRPWLFLIALVGSVGLTFEAQRRAARLSEGIAAGISTKIARGASAIGLIELDRIGRERLLRAATGEAADVARNIQIGLNFLSTTSCILLIVVFMIAINTVVGSTVVVTFLAVVPLLIKNAGRMRMAEARGLKAQSRFFDLATHALDGFRELRVNARKNRSLHDRHLVGAIERAGHANMNLSRARARQVRYIVFAWIFGLGLAGFVLPQFQSVSGLGAIAFLYSMMLSRSFDITFDSVQLVDAAAPIERLRKLMDELAVPPRASLPALPRLRFERLEAQGLTFAHRDPDGEEIFRVGPVDFRVERGEVVFLTGSNGSGKTTLIRVLTGLYPAEAGTVLIDGREAGPVELRQLYAAVFTDFTLLNPLYGLDDPDRELAEAMIERFELSRKVRYEGRSFSTTELSSGQRRRLALIAALLEERPLLLLDEWTADQDPEFRRKFFEEILPECKARGQAVVAITHDDRFFHHCDRRYHLHQGRLAEVIG